jgi:CO dehydrogenase maturation factor
MKIAVTGKGGVGKTVITSILASLLHKKEFKVLAVDADPNPNLAYTLGLRDEIAEKIVPIAENAELIEIKTGVKPSQYGSLFRLNFTVDDIIEKYAVETPCGVNLLIMGVVRDATAGCMCPANHLLRMLLRHLLVRRGEVVIADMEAGTEHLGRGTAEHVDAMLVVTEPSVKSFKTATHIKNFAQQMNVKNILLVGNKIINYKDENAIRMLAEREKIPLLGTVHYDSTVREAELSGKSILFSYSRVKAVKEISVACEGLLEIVGKKEISKG